MWYEVSCVAGVMRGVGGKVVRVLHVGASCVVCCGVGCVVWWGVVVAGGGLVEL